VTNTDLLTTPCGYASRDVDDDPWLTVAEIARELRINPATVRLWVSKGRLPVSAPREN
jgi:hypothetical protein